MTEVSCRALYAYNGLGGEKITTLKFEAGDVIKVLFSGDAGWWEGERNGSRGWFPASYVKQIQEEDAVFNDWKELITEDGETYYVNTQTHETSWEIPPSFEKTNNNNNLPQPIEKSANTSMNNAVNGRNHLSLPLSNTDGLVRSTSQPSTLNHREEDLSPTSPTSQSLPTTPEESPSPVLLREKSSPPNTPANGVPQRPRVRMVNGISFPDEVEAKEQSLLQPDKFSYCDYFWSDKVEGHGFQSGFCVLYQKMLKGKHICKELSDLLKAREAVETQYAKGLASVANSVLASQEGGTLGETIKEMKSATLLEAKIHQEFASKLRSEVGQHLLDQKDKEKKELKKLEAHIADLRKQVQLKYQAAERSKQLMLERTKDFEAKLNSPKHTTEDIQKARRKSTKHAEDLSHTVENYNKHRQQWFEEMVTSTLVLERHESARINTVKALLSHYTKLVSGANTKCNETCKTVNDFITKIDADKDRETWVRKNATGKIKPVDLLI